MLAALFAVLAMTTAGMAAPVRPSRQALQRLEIARQRLEQAQYERQFLPGKEGSNHVQRALDAYNAAREAVYGSPISPLSASGSFDGTVAEIESNNTAGTAQSLDAALAQEGAAVLVGEIRAAADVDFFSFTAPAGARVWVHVDTGGTQLPGGANRDSVLDLIDRDQTTVIENDDDDAVGNGRDGSVESTQASVIAGRVLPAAGTYFLRVTEFGNDAVLSPYRMYVVLTTEAGGNESEPNNGVDTPDTLLPVGARVGIMNGATDDGASSDGYRLALQAGDVVTVQLDADPGRTGSVDMTLALVAPGGGLLIGDGQRGFSFLATTSGVFLVLVVDSFPTGDYAVMAAVVTRTTGVVGVIHGALGNGSLDYPAISGTQVGRIFRNAVPSNCEGAPKPFPGLGNTTPQTFDAYVFKNRSGADACVSISLTAYDATPIHPVVYATFDPGDIAPGYLGDSGDSAIGGFPRTFSIRVAAGAVFVVTVGTVFGVSTGLPYTLSVTGNFRSSLVGPADMTVPNDLNQAGAVVNFAAPVPTDPSLGPVVCTPASGSFFPIGTTQVTCRDQGGSQHTFTVTVRDVQPPTLNVPASFTVAQDQAAGAVVNYVATAGDNSGGVLINCAPGSGTLFAPGVTLVTCTATDAAGNATMRAFQVTVALPNSTAGTRIAAKGNVPTNAPAPAFKVSGSVSAAGVPTRVKVIYTDRTGGLALVSSSIRAVVRAGNLVRILGTLRNGRKGALQNFVLEIRDVARPGINQDTFRLQVEGGPDIAQIAISKGEITLKP